MSNTQCSISDLEKSGKRFQMEKESLDGQPGVYFIFFYNYTQGGRKVSYCILKILHVSMHAMDDTAYFVTAIIYICP
jgi:inosine/xanthosine triphosphate pyrophosphatase family protein